MNLLWLIPLVAIILFLIYNLIVAAILYQNAPSAALPSASATKLVEGMDSNAPKPALRVMYFYAKWCGNCKDFKSTYDRLVANAAVSFPSTQFDAYDIDDAANSELVTRYSITGVPHIQFISDNDESWYQGDRSYSVLSGAIHKKEQAAIARLTAK